jgi:hypothetical protein
MHALFPTRRFPPDARRPAILKKRRSIFIKYINERCRADDTAFGRRDGGGIGLWRSTTMADFQCCQSV